MQLDQQRPFVSSLQTATALGHKEPLLGIGLSEVIHERLRHSKPIQPSQAGLDTMTHTMKKSLMKWSPFHNNSVDPPRSCKQWKDSFVKLVNQEPATAGKRKEVLMLNLVGRWFESRAGNRQRQH